jgi:type IV pilus assembly protein PilB
MAVYEFLQVTPLLRQCILQAVDTDKLWAQAIQDGMRPLTQNALDAARQRLIPLSEVYRVRME